MSEPITGLSSMATRRILAALATAYEQSTGRGVAVRSLGGVDAARLVRAGEPADFVVLAGNVMAALEAEGHVRPGSVTAVARSGIAVAVQARGVLPSIADEAALKAAVLAARRIAYSTGPSGTYLLRLWEGWGIADQIAGRLVQAPPGISVASLLAEGRADLGFQQQSELIGEPGIAILGPLPPAIQSVTTFVAGIARVSSRADEAGAWLRYLASRETEAVKRRNGMELE